MYLTCLDSQITVLKLSQKILFTKRILFMFFHHFLIIVFSICILHCWYAIVNVFNTVDLNFIYLSLN